MKDVNEFFEVDEDNNFFLKKDISLDEDTRQKLLSTILEIQQSMAMDYVEDKTNENNDKTG